MRPIRDLAQSMGGRLGFGPVLLHSMSPRMEATSQVVPEQKVQRLMCGLATLILVESLTTSPTLAD